MDRFPFAPVVFMGGFLCLATLLFASLEGLSLFDSFYFCVIAFTSVGFGDKVPYTFEGKLLFIFFSFLSMGIIVWALEAMGEWNLRMAKKLINNQTTFILSIFAMIAYLVIGTLVFAHFENLDFFHSLYMSTAALTTIGFGDVVPLSRAGKIAMVIFVLTGIGITSNALTQIRLKIQSTISQSRSKND